MLSGIMPGKAAFLRGLELAPIKATVLKAHQEHPDWDARKMANMFSVARSSARRWLKQKEEVNDMNHYTKDQINKAIELHNQGYGYSKIARQIGGAPSGWRGFFQRHPVGENDNSRNAALVQISDVQISDFYFQNGKSKQITGKHFGISPFLVCRRLIQAGHPEEAYPSMVPPQTSVNTEAIQPATTQTPDLSHNGHIRQFASELLHLVDDIEQLKIETEKAKEERDIARRQRDAYRSMVLEKQRIDAMGD